MKAFFLFLSSISFLLAQSNQDVIIQALQGGTRIYGKMLIKTSTMDKPIDVTVYQEEKRKRWEYPEFVLLFDRAQVYKVIPDSQIVIILDKNSSTKGEDFSLLTQNYTFEKEREEKIAGLSAEKFKVISKWTGQLAWIIWVYPLYPVVLKSIHWTRSGERLSESEFIQIEFPSDIDDSLFSFPQNWQVKSEKKIWCSSLREVETHTNFPVKEPDFIPKGFKLSSMEVFSCPKGRGIAHLFYQDGIYTFSVFEHSTLCMGEGMGMPGMMGKMRKMMRRMMQRGMERCMLPKSPYRTFLGNLLIVLEGELLPEEFEKVLSSF